MRLLKNLGVDAADLRKNIEQSLTPGLRKTNNLANIPLVKQAEKTLKLTYLEAKTFKSVQIGTEHLLLCILKESDNVVTKTLLRYGVDYDAARAELEGFLDNPVKSKIQQPVATTMIPTKATLVVEPAEAHKKNKAKANPKHRFLTILAET
jgi:ATP-dependent Clp protease ATP-binding subunit ClpC